MPLRERHLELTKEPLSPKVRSFLEAADLFCNDFFDTGANKRIPRFLPADYELVCRGLKTLKDGELLLGNRFCEWGSGLGIATCLASLSGYEAHGIEIEPELVKRSRTLAAQQQVPALFLESSFLPKGFDFLQTQGGRELMTPANARSESFAYEDCDWQLDDIDLFYAYPWPEEQQSHLDLFESVAADGAYLLCYFGDNDLCAYQKV
ncbi:hypothetical protein QEH56_22100 [Pelagicoccus enzymogenes]|uniref:hypothetical protein n=1 Tax=Pelagicoccus enzymogenes TaxID=2773457 RepID=UPI0028108899|nr:hypothetical protein [Pelagicoccus enzymogenes]MDQ8200876.1 hypothetical protein [Pelagicoccus enzymogenes]